MNKLTRAVIELARGGDEPSKLVLDQAARTGSKAAEGLLLQLVKENQAQTGEKDFAVAFAQTAAANEALHLAYLNANG